MKIFRILAGLALASSLFCGASVAGLVTYTDSATFLANLPGPATTLDFDSETVGTTIASGDTVGGITFSYDFGGVEIAVTDFWDTTSSPNFLGTNDGDIFQDGDDFDLSFGAVNAIGMFFITADSMADDDIQLSAGGAAASLVATDVQQTLPDGSDVFFLGIIDDMASFTTASITTIGGGFFLYNVDDITTAGAAPAPAPGVPLLLGTGLVGLLVTRRSKHQTTSRQSQF